ncbi:DUF748 domain-containing protein [Anaeromyxobacter oryzae]|uniref:DUF748 domain-containing protein n=1 Tax=Anaeromyxobacter oryzae TaxID=2918170 RepID=A0ABM7WNN7_9BACT|nr:DUF748 domain-containing protein [Anaeromyxobacter oryzae]BDG01078.1 hypothetical protein AMOR_00740 [Anaeromyxobacter oryzae]
MRRAGKVVAIVVAVLAVLAIALHLALDPLAAWYTRRMLAGMDGMRGTFSGVNVRLRDLSYEIHDLRIEKTTAGGAALPYFAVDRAEFGLYATELLHGHLVAAVELDRPRLNLLTAPARRDEEGEGKGKSEAASQEPKEAPKVGRRLERLAPFRLDRVQVRGGEILWIDAREKERPRLRLHGIEATLENFATRAALAKHEPTVLAARGTLQRSGKVTVFATADPLAKGLTFAGEGKLEGLRADELSDLLGAKSGVAPEKGVLEMAVAFTAVDGRLDGGVRPVLKGGELKAAKPGLANKLKELLGNAALKIFADDTHGRDAVATTVPIQGRVEGPQVQAVPTIVGILRNAFVRGLTASFGALPPPKAKEKENPLEQARRGLSPGHGPPRAQPSGEKG